MKSHCIAAGGLLTLALTLPLSLSAQGQGADIPAATPASIPGQPVNNQPADTGFVMFNNRIYVVSNGQATPLREEKNLKVTSSGVVDFNGVPLNLPLGSMLSLDGRVVPAPAGLRYTDGSPATTDTTPPPATPANAGQSNLSGSSTSSARPAGVSPPLGGNPGYADRGVTGENLSGLAPATNRAPAATSGSVNSTPSQSGTQGGAAMSGSSNNSSSGSSGRGSNDSRGGGVYDPNAGVVVNPIPGQIAPGAVGTPVNTSTNSANTQEMNRAVNTQSASPTQGGNGNATRTNNPAATPTSGANTATDTRAGNINSPGLENNNAAGAGNSGNTNNPNARSTSSGNSSAGSTTTNTGGNTSTGSRTNSSSGRTTGTSGSTTTSGGSAVGASGGGASSGGSGGGAAPR